jgi:hypothetical protein
MRLHIIRGTAAITGILATRTTAITRAITAMVGEATIGLGGGLGTTAGIMEGIMVGGTGAGGAAETGGAAADGMAADGMAIIDSESRPDTRRPSP